MRYRFSKRVRWGSLVAVAYLALVALAYAVGSKPGGGCTLGGHGTLTTAFSDQASFVGLLSSAPAGAIEYQDAGPGRPLRMTSSSVARLSCADHAAAATVFGRASVVGAVIPPGVRVTYRIDARFARQAGRGYTFRVRLSDGYDSGAGQITHGSVEVRDGGTDRVYRAP